MTPKTRRKMAGAEAAAGFGLGFLSWYVKNLSCKYDDNNKLVYRRYGRR
jgi:hypothetical protein